MRVGLALLLFVLGVILTAPTALAQSDCSPAYPTLCLPPAPDLDCKDISARNFQVLPPDPHRLDRDHDGIGCEA